MKKIKEPNIKDLITSVIFLCFSLVGWFYLIPYTIINPSFISATGASLGIDSRLFPRIAMLAVLAMSVCLLIHFLYTWRKYKKICPEYDLKRELTSLMREYWYNDKIVIVTAAILVLYCILINVLGFVISSILLTAGINFLMGIRNWKGLILAPVALVGIVYLLFTTLLYVDFPHGLLF